MSRGRQILPWAIAAMTVLALAGSFVLAVLAGEHGSSTLQGVLSAVATISTSAVGLVLATRRRSNSIGWILLGSGVFLALQGLTTTYAEYAILADPGALPAPRWAVAFEDRTWPALFFGVTAIAFVFPDGTVPRDRRRAAVGTAIAFGALLLAAIFSADPFGAPFESVEDPIPSAPEALVFVLFIVGIVGALAGMVMAALSLRKRFRSSTGGERMQMLWLGFAAAIVPFVIAICLLENAITGSEGLATVISLSVVLIGFPVAIGIAVLRYRLYEIDRLINRTLVYATTTVLLGGAFAAVSLGVGVSLGSGSALPTAAATLAVALIFGPLRARVQVAVDRRFDRARFEGLQKVDAFLAELRAGRVAPEAAGEVLSDALEDPSLELLFWLSDASPYVDRSGQPQVLGPDDRRARTPVTRGSLRLATVLHSPELSERPDLLDSVIEAAGLAIEIGRLRVEVRRRLAEVEESRARIVTAGNEERRRLERDLHDGAQQRLVSIGLDLRHLQAKLSPDDLAARDSLDGVVADVTTAIAELRELARGVRPPALDDGLAAALRQLSSRSPLPTSVDSTAERFTENVETAAYFVASEALTNVVKHANASRVRVRAARDNGNLVVSVTDDGVGGAVASDGSGLEGIADRLAALGGVLRVSSTEGQGTVVTAELPCG